MMVESSALKLSSGTTSILYSLDFAADIRNSDLTRIRKNLKLATPGIVDSPADRPIIGHLVESGAWGDCWLTMIQLGDRVFRLLVTSDRPHCSELERTQEVCREVVSMVAGEIEDEKFFDPDSVETAATPSPSAAAA